MEGEPPKQSCVPRRSRAGPLPCCSVAAGPCGNKCTALNDKLAWIRKMSSGVIRENMRIGSYRRPRNFATFQRKNRRLPPRPMPPPKKRGYPTGRTPARTTKSSDLATKTYVPEARSEWALAQGPERARRPASAGQEKSRKTPRKPSSAEGGSFRFFGLLSLADCRLLSAANLFFQQVDLAHGLPEILEIQ
jgi:hypothetical protein